ncbi:hypothetical protein [Nonomuraea sediminis]|uniref:hypothetical protein n=1 Tax=Nonomuraea sediminis TaxID=2835864 RepID=UPI001BDDA8EE|nr:hypothetical protein [Nonomuraea sediminis]
MALLGGFLLLLAPAIALTGRERSLAGILPATGASQVILHILLGQTSGSHMVTPDMAGMGHQTPASGFGMFALHAASVLVTSVWLRWAEAGLCALVRHLAGWALRPLLVLFFLLTGWMTSRPGAITRAREDETARIRLFLRYARVLRGPPEGQPRTAAAA